VASLIRNSEAAPAVVQLVLFPLVFISGSYMPIHSGMLNRISGVLPVRPFNLALMGPFAQQRVRLEGTSACCWPGAPQEPSAPSAASAGIPDPNDRRSIQR
jgi:hypothetical protein